MRIDSPKVSNLTFQTGSGVADSSFTGSFSGSFTGVGNFTGLTADSVEYANILNRPSGLVSGSSSEARAQIGLVIGTDVQAFQQNLTDISNLNPADGTFIVGAGSSFVAETGATARASLGLGSLAVLNTDAALGSIDLSGNSSYSFANLTNLPTLVSGSASDVRSFINVEDGADVTDTTNVVAALTAGTNVAIASDGTISSTDTTYTVGNGGLTQNNFTNALKSKLDGIEASADVTDATNVEAAGALMDSELSDLAGIKALTVSTKQDVLAEGEFADGDKTKLDGIETGADVTDTDNVVGALTAGSNITIAGDGTISSTNTNTQLSSEQVEDIVGGMVDGNTETGITVTYQDADGTLDFVVASQTDNNFTNTLKTKLDGIETGATADQSAAEIKTAYESNSDTNAFTDADHSKLDGIEANADVTDTANVTAAGALMDSEVDADLKTFSLPANTTISAFGKTLVDDADAAAARTTLGVDAAGTDNSTDVSLSGTPDYITISGQTITRNLIDLSTDVTGTLPVGNMSATALTTVQTAANESAQLALTAQEGDVVVRTDENKTYMHNGGTAGTMADYTELATPTDSVTSVNGNTGAVTVTENVTTNLSTTANGTSLVINSSDGTNASIPAATTSAWGAMTDEDKTKLDGIESGATGDQSNAEIRAAVAAATDSNVFTDADHTKLDGIEASADVTDTANVVAALTAGTNVAIASDGTISSTDTNTFRTVQADGTAIGATETLNLVGGSNVTLTESGGEITIASTDTNTTYSVGDGGLTQNNFTNALKTKLDGIAASANNYSLPAATTTTLGGVKLISTTAQTVAANTLTSTAARTYGIEKNSDGRLVVNVPWFNTDTNTTYSVGDGGLTQKNFTTTLKDKLDGIEASADVTDTANVVAALTAGTNVTIAADGTISSTDTNTNTTYSAGTGLDLTGTTFSIETDLRDSISYIGYDSGDYIQWSNNAWTRTVVNGTERLRVDTSGIDVSGRIVADGDITAYSDERLKKDVVTIDGALAKTVSLRGVEYTRIADDTKSIGVIAQEVEQVFPELVLTDDEGFKSVNYAQLTGVLIEAVKELAARVNELEAN